jgi:hypothetical protein
MKVVQELINVEAADYGELLLRGNGDGNTRSAKLSEERVQFVLGGFLHPQMASRTSAVWNSALCWRARARCE